VKSELIRLLPQLIEMEPDDILSDKDDNFLCMCEQLIGGSLLEAIIAQEFTTTTAAAADIIVDGNDDWEPFETSVIREFITTLDSY